MLLFRQTVGSLLLLGGASACLPSLAIERCDSPVFYCQIAGSAKAVSVCESGERITYTFGPLSGAAELVLGVDRRHAKITPWNGVGYTYSSSIEIPSGPWAYRLASSYERGASSDPGKGSLTVLKNGKSVRTLPCDPNTLEERVETLLSTQALAE